MRCLKILSAVNHNTGDDYQAALDCNEQYHKMQEKKLGNTHRQTLTTHMKMPNMSSEGWIERISQGGGDLQEGALRV